MSKKIFLGIITFIILFLSYLSYSSTQNKLENVILISVDTLRPDHLVIYGYNKNSSPNINAFFKDKSIFENAISPSPCTIPAVLQLLTGSLVFKSKSKRLAEALRENGYNTSAIVSQHHFSKPDHTAPKRIYQRGFSHFDLQAINQHDNLGFTARTANEISDLAIKWLKHNYSKGKYFLWLHYYDPHDPYNPKYETTSYFKDNPSINNGDVRTFLKKGIKNTKADWRLSGHLLKDKDIQYLKDQYDNEIKLVDYEINRVLDILKELKQIKKSLIIFLSDHGERLGEDNTWNHCLSLYNLEIKVPFLISLNGKNIHNLKRVKEPVSTLDIYPTVLDLLNINYNKQELSGISLLNLQKDRHVYSIWKKAATIMNNEWKLHYRNGKLFLYNIKSDINEKNNLANQEKEIAEKLSNKLKNHLKNENYINTKIGNIIEKLRSLGYL